MTVTNDLTIIVSALSLLVSIISLLYTWMRTKDRITIKWHTKMFHLGVPSIILNNYTLIPTEFTKLKGHKDNRIGTIIKDPYLAQITIINYGNNDIGYFGLSITDQDKHKYPVITKNIIKNIFGFKYILRMAKSLETHSYCNQWRAVHVPNDIYGVLKAHSYYIWNIITSGRDNHISSLKFQIGLTEKHWYKSAKSKSFKGKIKIYHNPNTIINDVKNSFNSTK